MNNELAAKVDHKYIYIYIYRIVVHLCDVSKPASTNMATIRYLEIMSNECDVCRICGY